MTKKLIVAAALMSAVCGTPAVAAVNLTGANVTATLFFDDLGEIYSGPVAAVVGAGMEFAPGAFSSPNSAGGSFDITGNSIKFFTNQTATYGGTGTFNGYRLDFSNYSGSLSDLTILGGTFSPLGFSASGDSVFLNVRGQSVRSTDFASLSAVPEPATWGMMILGFGAVGYSVRRRTKAGARLAHAA